MLSRHSASRPWCNSLTELRRMPSILEMEELLDNAKLPVFNILLRSVPAHFNYQTVLQALISMAFGIIGKAHLRPGALGPATRELDAVADTLIEEGFLSTLDSRRTQAAVRLSLGHALHKKGVIFKMCANVSAESMARESHRSGRFLQTTYIEGCYRTLQESQSNIEQLNDTPAPHNSPALQGHMHLSLGRRRRRPLRRAASPSISRRQACLAFRVSRSPRASGSAPETPLLYGISTPVSHREFGFRRSSNGETSMAAGLWILTRCQTPTSSRRAGSSPRPPLSPGTCRAVPPLRLLPSVANLLRGVNWRHLRGPAAPSRCCPPASPASLWDKRAPARSTEWSVASRGCCCRESRCNLASPTSQPGSNRSSKRRTYH